MKRLPSDNLNACCVYGESERGKRKLFRKVEEVVIAIISLPVVIRMEHDPVYMHVAVESGFVREVKGRYTGFRLDIVFCIFLMLLPWLGKQKDNGTTSSELSFLA